MLGFLKFLCVLYIQTAIGITYNTNVEQIIEEHEKNSTFLGQAGYRPVEHILAKYVVSLRWRKPKKFFGDNHMCGGSFLSSKAVLTAAHCVTDDNGQTYKIVSSYDIEVVAGTPYRTKVTPTTRASLVKSILVHPDYNPDTLEADMSILYLMTEIELDGKSRSNAPLVNKNPKLGTLCTVSGWGKIFYDGPFPAEIVYVDLYLVSSSKSSEFEISLTDRANREKRVGKGDSGGPLICDGMLAGVCSAAQFEDVLFFDHPYSYHVYYASVYYYQDWILMNINLAVKFKNSIFYVFAVLFFNYFM